MRIAKKLRKEAEKRVQQQSGNSSALSSNDNVRIISKNSTENKPEVTETGSLFEAMLAVIEPVDFKETFVDKLGDPLVKYQSESGIDLTRVHKTLYGVAILKELQDIVSKYGWDFAQQDGMLYIYNGKYWVRVEENDIKSFLSKATIRLGYYSPAEAQSSNFTDLLFRQFLQSSYSPEINTDPNVVLINLQNGTYEITVLGARLREHRKDDFLTYCLPFSYDKDAQAPLFIRYLHRVLPDISSQELLQEFIGYIFIKHLKLEKALILLGSGKNGKSVMFEIISALLGPINVSTKSLGDLVDRDSGNDNRAKLKDKLVNYGSEISSKGMNVDMFKRLVSGEPVAAREKYKTSFDLRNNCKFIFNANKLPAEIEHTEAYFRRFIIIPFTEQITDEEKDPELHTKIIANELPGVLNWAIEGLNRLLSNKDFSKCSAAEEALAAYKKESNSVALMIEEEGLVDGYDVDTEHRLSNKKLYEMYREYCSDSGMRPLNRINFSKELKNLGFTPYRIGKERGFVIQKSASE